MAGMKEGAGEDPFAEDSDDDQDVESADVSTPSETVSTTESERETQSTDSTVATDEIPYIIRRQTVKEDRNDRHTYFLREEFVELEDEIHEAVADELDTRQKDVSVTDVREAIVATADADEVAEKLREWGVEHTL